MEKGNAIDGLVIFVRTIYEKQIEDGDKITNRHGNKGVCCPIIFPDDKMPELPDGRKVDIVLNTLGIPSRMNLGQLFEIELGNCIFEFRKQLKEITDYNNLILKIGEFLEIIDKTKNKWVSIKILTDFENDYNKYGKDYAIENFYIIQPPFESINYEDRNKLMILCKTTPKSIIKYNGIEVRNPVTNGYMYFVKSNHRSSSKFAARSIGSYNIKTMQPISGRNHKGGHRLGEMEVWSLMAHSADKQLKDFLTLQSDSTGKKNKFLINVINNQKLLNELDEESDTPKIIRLFKSNMKILGLDITP